MARANIIIILQAAGETEDLEAFASTMMVPVHQLAEAVVEKHFEGKIQVLSVGPLEGGDDERDTSARSSEG